MGVAYSSRMASHLPAHGRFGRSNLLFASALFLVLIFEQGALATDRHWTGTTDGTWGTSTNWDTGLPGVSDNAVFDSTFTNQPNLVAATTVGGLWMTGNIGQNVTISGSTLTLQGNTINGTAGLGILIDNANAFTLTISAPLKIAAAQAWRNNSSNLFTIGAGGVNTNGFALTIDGSGNTTVSGIISGSGSLTKSGSGTLSLGGANTYSGATSITAGVLSISNAASLGTTANGTTVSNGAALQILGGIAVGAEALTLNGSGISNTGALRNISGNNSMSGTVTLASASTIGSDAGTLTISGAFNNGGFLLTETGAGNLTLSGVLSGIGGLTMNGSGTLTLSGSSNTFTGTTTVDSGILALNSLGDAIAGALVVGDNVSASGSAIVRLLQGNQLPDTTSVTVNSSGVLDWNGFTDKVGATTLYSGTISGASITTGVGKFHATDTITLAVSGTGAVGATISGNMVDGGAVRTIFVNDGAADADLTISAVMQGSKGYIKDGPGRLVMSGANTNTGTLAINAGPLQLQNASAISAFSGSTVNSGGAIEFTGGISYTLGNGVTINGSGVNSTGALLNVTGSNTYSDAVTLASASTIGSTAGTLTLAGAINNGGFTLTTAGAGNIMPSGVISGTGGLTKNGSGTVTLGGTSANTYSGVTAVNDGELDLNKTSGLNAFAGNLTVGDGVGANDSAITKLLASNEIPGVAVTVNTDGLLNLNNFSDTIGALTMTSGDVTTGTGTLTLGGTVTGNAASSSANITGNLALGGNRTFAIADGSAAVDMNVSAVVSGAFTVTKNGTGTLVFSGANTYTGATTVSAGVLDIQNATALGTIAAGTTVSSGATLALEGGITVGAESLSIAGSGSSGQNGALVNVSGTNNYGGLLTLTAASTISSDSGTLNLTNGGTITGATFGLTLTGAGTGNISSIIGTTSGSLTKNGTGTFTLTGVNTYSGATTVNAGSLFVNGNQSAATGAVSVNNSATTLGGSGTIGGSVTVASGANLSPGSTGSGSTAILRTGALSLTSGSNFVLDLNNTTVGTGYDQVSVTGTVNITGSNLVITVGSGLSIGNTFFILANDSSDAVVGTFSQGTTVTSGNDLFQINYAANFDGGAIGNDIALTLIAILPEPSTWTAGVIAVAIAITHGIISAVRGRFAKAKGKNVGQGSAASVGFLD